MTTHTSKDDETLYIYTDASFSKSHDLAVMGYVVFKNKLEHELADVSKLHVNINSVKEKNNIRAEVKATILALNSCPTGSNVILFSDCQTVVGLPRRKEKLIASKFIGRKENILNNADIYQEFYKESDRVQLIIHWIEGHISKDKKNKSHNIFSSVDKKVRRKLREIIKADLDLLRS